MTRRGWVISLSLVAMLILLGLWIGYSQFWKVDACLDSGGAWGYSTKECRH